MAKQFFQRTACFLRVGLLALALAPSLAVAQQSEAVAPPAPAQTERGGGFFAGIGRWLNQQSVAIQSAWQGMNAHMRSLGRQADIAAQTSADTAKQAAGTVAKLGSARVVTGYQRCATAPNGAPDCLQAVAALCKSKGFENGTSLAMTAAEDCPVKVYASGRNGGPECTSFTFVSRALCH